MGRQRRSWIAGGLCILEMPGPNSLSQLNELNSNINLMKTILTILTVLGLATAAYAGCGKKVTDEGSLESFDKDAKTVTVKGAKKPFEISSSTEIKDKDGNAAKIEDLVGKAVKIVSEHNKAESITGA